MKDFGEYILSKKKVSLKEIQHAREVASATASDLIEVMLNHNLIDEKNIFQYYKDVFDLELQPLPKVLPYEIDFSQLSRDFCQQRIVLPLSGTDSGEEFLVALENPADESVIQDIEFLCEKKVRLAYCSKGKILEAIQNSQNSGFSNFEFSRENSGEGRIVSLVNSIIADAISRRASDIHIEPDLTTIHVRFRIDGVLSRAGQHEIFKEEYGAVVSRIKILANLDISEKRLPQDGRILFRSALKNNNKETDLRVSILPSIQGETLVLRILDRDATLVDINSIGLIPKYLKSVKETLARSNGMILTCGPTGSGKTTSLYAMLTYLNTGKRKILTIEDPIEYQINGIQQIQAHSQIGLTFADGLRSFLRHDPDVIMVGEIRDEETAEIAIRAALTGHMVLSTLHTNDSASAITRLLDMKMKPYLLASTISLVVSQRLVRKVCSHCAQMVKVDAKVLKERNFNRYLKPWDKIMVSKGCHQCSFTGYMGRFALFEFLPVSSIIKKAILEEKSAEEIQQLAVREKMQTLMLAAMDAAKKGLTTLEEIIRVVYV